MDMELRLGLLGAVSVFHPQARPMIKFADL
jgi:hypothetical protein